MEKIMTILGMVFLLALGVLVGGITLQAVAMPTLPNDLNIIPPDPSLPKELAAFSGKWHGVINWGNRSREIAIIFEKISEKEASIYYYDSELGGWNRNTWTVVNERGTWKIWTRGRTYINTLYMKDGKLVHDIGVAINKYSRVD